MTNKEVIDILEDMKVKIAIPRSAKTQLDKNEALEIAIKNLKIKSKEKETKGHWENGNSICPCCGEDKFKDLDADIWADWKPNFCPNCGSDMREREE